ncbi:hypothetical protein A6R68_14666 [Neotoma lepida]|uniref:Prohormone convertase 3 n=1 Tax=Neotoma lepida TaxID=56216 RepID=A0A1A6H910_NEOLE|nr:hypothetical protein A6R68_14666 [Neotoma lepida]
MRPSPTSLWLGLALALALPAVGWASARVPIYVSSWAVRVTKGYQEAERLARKFGFVNLGQIFPDDQYFHLRHRGVAQQSLTPHWGHHLRLKKEPKVRWFEQQTLRRRVKRSLVAPTDPWFSKQWYMNNEIQPDLNVLKVWNQGLTGRGVRMLDGTITDIVEAQSLSLQPQHIHIYSASWGPEDDGRTVDGPGILTREAFRRGVTKGRQGLGTLFIWASGNGGLHYDNCNCDGYTNSIHTLSVGSTTRQGRVPWYSEACASTFTTTFSSGVATDPQIMCIRDSPDPPPGATRPTAGPQDGPHLTSPILPRMLVAKNVSACSYGSHRFIRSLEHVQVQLSLSYSRRGDLEISLTSPMGTRSTLVAIRPLDISGQGYNNWIFMSTHYWDENPQGLWTLGLENKGYYFNTGTLFYYTLLLYGTGEDMTARPQGPQPAVVVAPEPQRAASDRGTAQLSPSYYTCWGSLTSDYTACSLSLMLDELQGSSKACHLR